MCVSLNSDKDLENYFIRSDVQKLLKQITGFNIDKIFRERKVDDIAEPKYKLLTTSQLQEVCTFNISVFDKHVG